MSDLYSVTVFIFRFVTTTTVRSKKEEKKKKPHRIVNTQNEQHGVYSGCGKIEAEKKAARNQITSEGDCKQAFSKLKCIHVHCGKRFHPCGFLFFFFVSFSFLPQENTKINIPPNAYLIDLNNIDTFSYYGHTTHFTY